MCLIVLFNRPTGKMFVLLLLVFGLILQLFLNKGKVLCPKESSKDGESSRGHDLRGVAEDARFVHLGEEETEG